MKVCCGNRSRASSWDMAHPRNYRIGVIADTHDRWLPRVAELFAGVDEIWHLGDVCQRAGPRRAARDQQAAQRRARQQRFRPSIIPLTFDLERCGEKLPSRPHPAPPHLAARLRLAALRPHPPAGGTRCTRSVHLFNPGSAGRANKGAPLSVGFLIREKGIEVSLREPVLL